MPGKAQAFLLEAQQHARACISIVNVPRLVEEFGQLYTAAKNRKIRDRDHSSHHGSFLPPPGSQDRSQRRDEEDKRAG